VRRYLRFPEAAEALASNNDEETALPAARNVNTIKIPFVTDGRGRVVWSRTARGSQAQAQVERERRRSSPPSRFGRHRKLEYLPQMDQSHSLTGKGTEVVVGSMARRRRLKRVMIYGNASDGYISSMINP